MALNDLTGKRFDRLEVVARAMNQSRMTAWLCRCDCGETKIIRADHLRNGDTKSCGCHRRELLRHTTHGYAHRQDGKLSRTYRAWSDAKRRCYSPTTHGYHHYGGRGIAMCDRWRNDYPAFLADMGEVPPGLTLERIDNDQGYEPSNCKWATWQEQARNKRPRRVSDG